MICKHIWSLCTLLCFASDFKAQKNKFLCSFSVSLLYFLACGFALLVVSVMPPLIFHYCWQYLLVPTMSSDEIDVFPLTSSSLSFSTSFWSFVFLTVCLYTCNMLILWLDSSALNYICCPFPPSPARENCLLKKPAYSFYLPLSFSLPLPADFMYRVYIVRAYNIYFQFY